MNDKSFTTKPKNTEPGFLPNRHLSCIRFTMLCRALIVLLFIIPALSYAVTFKECDDLLTANINLTPYSVGKLQALSDQDLSLIQDLFDKYGKEEDLRTFESSLYLKNPFALYSVITPDGQIEVSPLSAYNTKLEESEALNLHRLLKIMLQQTLDETKTSPALSLLLEGHRKLHVCFFGIRYFLKQGLTPALNLHRDMNSRLQSLIEIKRPAALNGGHTVVAWPRDSLEEMNNGGFANKDVVSRIWEPRAKANHLLVFDGRHGLHGTSDFFIADENQNSSIRDVLGMTIDVVE